MRWRVFHLIAVMTAVNAACSDSPVGPTLETVAGAYTATEFTATDPGTTTDLLALGAFMTLTLRANGTTAGRLFVPGGDDNGADLDADLAGSWSIDGATILMTSAAASFLGDLDFVFVEGHLVGVGIAERAVIRIVLTR